MGGYEFLKNKAAAGGNSVFDYTAAEFAKTIPEATALRPTTAGDCPANKLECTSYVNVGLPVRFSRYNIDPAGQVPKTDIAFDGSTNKLRAGDFANTIEIAWKVNKGTANV